MNSLTLAIHGPSGVGKSWLADTAPAPRLILDPEGGTRFTPSPKVVWDPRMAPPEAETAVVRVDSLETMASVSKWLRSGLHPFRSLVVDPLTELGRLLAMSDEELSALARACCALTLQAAPLECVAFVCWDNRVGDIAYAVDVVAHLSLQSGARRASFIREAGVDAKDRTNRLGPYLDDPTIPRMFRRVYEKETA